MIDEPILKEPILGYLADHPDSTSIEIARGIKADEWDVQIAVCRLIWNDSIIQAGMRPVDGTQGQLANPIYRVAPNKGTT